jgi:hypothetical protein
MKNVNKKIVIILGIIWSIIWIYLIITKYNKQSLYLYISEFAVVFSIFILSSILIQIKNNKKETIRFFIITILLGAIFSVPIYILSKNILIIIYLSLSIIFNLINFYFVDLEEKISSFKIGLKNMIFLVLAGIMGVGMLSIIVYNIFKIIERTLKLFDIDLIKFGYKK